MAILFKSQGEGSHWYSPTGDPVHRLPAAKGGDRAVWITDAKRLHLLPSVTNVLGVLAKPQLDTWKLNQVALAAFRNPPQPDEPEEYFAKRVVELSKKPTADAADLGTRIHDALDKALAGLPFADDLLPYVSPVQKWRESVKIEIIEREIVVTNGAQGYAGRVDVLFRYGERGFGVLDYKTRKTKPGEEVTPYDGQAAQLAAYAAAYFGEDALDRALLANLYISTTEPGRIEVVKHDNPRGHYEFFLAACRVWRYLKGYDPRVVGAA